MSGPIVTNFDQYQICEIEPACFSDCALIVYVVGAIFF